VGLEILYESDGRAVPPKLTEQFVVFAHDIRSEVFFRIIDWAYSLALDAIKAGKWTVELSIKYLEKALKIIWWLIDTLRSGTSLNLQETGHQLYLHVYDSQGRHVGLNYESDQIEVGIVGANYFELEGLTLIALPSEITDFRYVVDAREAKSFTETYTLAVSTLKDGFAVSEETRTETIRQGEKQEHSVQVSSDGKSIWIDRPWWDMYGLWLLSGALVVIIGSGVVIYRTKVGKNLRGLRIPKGKRRRRKKGRPEVLGVISGPRIIEVASAPRILEIKEEE